MQCFLCQRTWLPPWKVWLNYFQRTRILSVSSEMSAAQNGRTPGVKRSWRGGYCHVMMLSMLKVFGWMPVVWWRGSQTSNEFEHFLRNLDFSSNIVQVILLLGLARTRIFLNQHCWKIIETFRKKKEELQFIASGHHGSDHYSGITGRATLWN